MDAGGSAPAQVTDNGCKKAAASVLAVGLGIAGLFAALTLLVPGIATTRDAAVATLSALPPLTEERQKELVRLLQSHRTLDGTTIEQVVAAKPYGFHLQEWWASDTWHAGKAAAVRARRSG